MHFLVCGRQLCWAGVLFCRPLTTLPSPCLSHLTRMYPREGRTVGVYQMFCQNMSGNLSLLSEACGIRACGWGRAATSFHMGWSYGMQGRQALGQAGFGGPVGLPILYGAHLCEVLEHRLEFPSTSCLALEAGMIPSLLDPTPKHGGMRYNSCELGACLSTLGTKEENTKNLF